MLSKKEFCKRLNTTQTLQIRPRELWARSKEYGLMALQSCSQTTLGLSKTPSKKLFCKPQMGPKVAPRDVEEGVFASV
jgi:hypothetical protein